MRTTNEVRRLDEREVDADPFKQFREWLDEAIAAKLIEPYAMTLATATHDSLPSVRFVLLRDFDTRGFVFYTNYASRKGRELAENPRASLAFYWAELNRQVRVEGRVEKVSAEESDQYFAGRPRESQLSAWASDQSRIIKSRAVLEERVQAFAEKFPGNVARPPQWGGYRLIPDTIEFWQGQPGRLHDRLRYSRQTDDSWLIERLAP